MLSFRECCLISSAHWRETRLHPKARGQQPAMSIQTVDANQSRLGMDLGAVVGRAGRRFTSMRKMRASASQAHAVRGGHQLDGRLAARQASVFAFDFAGATTTSPGAGHEVDAVTRVQQANGAVHFSRRGHAARSPRHAHPAPGLAAVRQCHVDQTPNRTGVLSPYLVRSRWSVHLGRCVSPDGPIAIAPSGVRRHAGPSWCPPCRWRLLPAASRRAGGPDAHARRAPVRAALWDSGLAPAAPLARAGFNASQHPLCCPQV